MLKYGHVFPFDELAINNILPTYYISFCPKISRDLSWGQFKKTEESHKMLFFYLRKKLPLADLY